MPFFLILPIWFLAIFAATAALFLPRLRFLSTYLFFGSTLSVALSFALSTAVLYGVPRLSHEGSSMGLVTILAYLFAIVAGGIAGLAAGLLIARSINQRIAWLKKSP